MLNQLLNPFLTNNALQKFVEGVKLNEKDKGLLVSRIPQMDEGERIRLFETLKEVYFVDLEEEKAIERLRKYWK